MKQRRLVCLMLCILLAVLPAGCSGKKNGVSTDNDNTDVSADAQQDDTGDEDFSIQMTDAYTFTDPADLVFDKRYVLVGDKNCKLLSDMNNMGYQAETMYEIIYENEGKPAGEYQYFVTSDEASAQDLEAYYQSIGQNITRDGNILYAFVDGDSLEALIITYAGYGQLSDETVEAYADMMKSFNGLTDYKN